MEKSKLFLFIAVLLTFSLSSCLKDDEEKDKVEKVQMVVSGETGFHTPFGSPEQIECMLVKEVKSDYFFPLHFEGISGFEYEKGYVYTLLVKKIILANPPQDTGGIEYELIDIVSKEAVEN